MSIDRMPSPVTEHPESKRISPLTAFSPLTQSGAVQNAAKQEVEGGKSCSVAVGEEKRKNEGEREGKDRSQGRGCMYSWSPQSTVRGRMTRIEGKLGHVEKYSCNDPSSIICLPHIYPPNQQMVFGTFQLKESNPITSCLVNESKYF